MDPLLSDLLVAEYASANMISTNSCSTLFSVNAYDILCHTHTHTYTHTHLHTELKISTDEIGEDYKIFLLYTTCFLISESNRQHIILFQQYLRQCQLRYTESEPIESTTSASTAGLPVLSGHFLLALPPSSSVSLLELCLSMEAYEW